MINVDLQKLVNALDAPTRADLEGTAERCVARGGSRVLVEDLLLALLERPTGLLAAALLDAEVDVVEMASTLRVPLGTTPGRSPVFSTELVQWLQDALLVANLELGQTHIGQAALILALLRNPLRYAGAPYQALLGRINADRLQGFALSKQSECIAPLVSPEGESLLARFTRNLTEDARGGRLDPVLCRETALRQMIDVLARRRKNNPIIVGEAGVGKSAVVEGLAQRIVSGEVPDALKHVELLSLDIGALQAGASIKGEFERRLKGLINEVQACAKPVILFIDEAHTLIGAGNQAGGSDAANLLKPALARGELRTVAATTWSEYKKYFEKDPALARRFQPVKLHEPSVQEAITILRGLAPRYEESHGVYLRDDAVVAAARLSARYLAGRQLPDKAVDVLDTACARVRISLAARPECLERVRAERAESARELEAMKRDADAGLQVAAQSIDQLQDRLRNLHERMAELEAQWQVQRIAAERVLDLRKRLAALPGVSAGHCMTERSERAEEAGESAALRRQLGVAHQTLIESQASGRLVSFEVCPRLVAEVVSGWTGVPLNQLALEHDRQVASFASDLRQRVLGQEQAVTALDRAMRSVAAGLNKGDAPVGVFLLVGPSGVGKTESALALADLLYGGDRFLTVINMSEFQEKHTVSRLIGAPPGYVGYGEGGMLTEAVRQKPYSVILLDEVEKADPDVMNLFYQIFDKGIANDGEGREIDFRNTLILMTSNLGTEHIQRMCQSGGRPDPETLEASIRPILNAHFKPALLARMQVVPYFPVDDQILAELVVLKLERLRDRLSARQLRFTHTPALVDYLRERCRQSDSGARLVDRLLDEQVLPLIADQVLDGMAGGKPVSNVHISLDPTGCMVCQTVEGEATCSH